MDCCSAQKERITQYDDAIAHTHTHTQIHTHTDTHMSTHQTIERNCVSQESETKSKRGKQLDVCVGRGGN